MKTEITPIPFTINLWNTEKFYAVYRNGNKARIICVDASGECPVISDNGDSVIMHYNNGSPSWTIFYDSMLNEYFQASEHDIMLLPID